MPYLKKEKMKKGFLELEWNQKQNTDFLEMMC